ncbi:hypothetical protein B0H16DRAFT_1783223 [Mycena metata]|uniref:Uncharacterized protein n=1 Tax=Mycena metata TaxID=1033252 RepID=A0AAD7KGJ1_9AGAR|nr:hypothetical protein B0H16DRAFT_1783223 [Mycena metata]
MARRRFGVVSGRGSPMPRQQVSGASSFIPAPPPAATPARCSHDDCVILSSNETAMCYVLPSISAGKLGRPSSSALVYGSSPFCVGMAPGMGQYCLYAAAVGGVSAPAFGIELVDGAVELEVGGSKGTWSALSRRDRLGAWCARPDAILRRGDVPGDWAWGLISAPLAPALFRCRRSSAVLIYCHHDGACGRAGGRGAAAVPLGFPPEYPPRRQRLLVTSIADFLFISFILLLDNLLPTYVLTFSFPSTNPPTCASTLPSTHSPSSPSPSLPSAVRAFCEQPELSSLPLCHLPRGVFLSIRRELVVVERVIRQSRQRGRAGDGACGSCGTCIPFSPDGGATTLPACCERASSSNANDTADKRLSFADLAQDVL